MKLYILQSDLIGPLQSVSRSIALRPQLPVLNNVLLQTEKDTLKISTTNLEIGVIKQINAEVMEEGSITIPAKIFTEIINSLPGERLNLEVSADQLKISTTSFSGTLNGISASEFPAIPLSSDESLEISADLIQKSLPQIAFASAIDEARPTLTGIYTQIKDNSFELVATDGFRLAHKKVVTPQKNSHNFKFLIPRRTFEEVVRLIGEDIKGSSTSDTPLISMSTSENQNQIVFQIGTTQLSSRLIEGNYPTWEKIVPTTFQSHFEIDRNEFIKAIKLASVFARDGANVVKLEVDKTKMQISSESHDLGAQQTDLEIQNFEEVVKTEKMVIAFNNKYLLDPLQSCHSKTVKMSFSGNLSPAIITPVEEEGLRYVVMPIRIS